MTDVGKSIIVYVVCTILIVLAMLLMWKGAADAKDNGQWTGTDPETKEWFQRLKQPHPFEWSSCCGEADAYYCDTVHVVDKQTTCTITDTRDDIPLGRPHLDVGTVIAIPDDKLKWDEGNPTGHAIVFLGGSGDGGLNRPVFCFVQNGGV